MDMQLYLLEAPSLSETIRAAWRFDPTIFTRVQNAAGGLWLAIAIVTLAAFSESLGQSVVLFLNRIRPYRFILALLISTFSNMISYLLWTTSIWLIMRYAFGIESSYLSLAILVGVAYAPQLFAFFELLPFMGNTFGLFLSLWSMAAIVTAIYAGNNILFWQAVVASGLGWGLIQLWRRSLGRPIYALGRFIQQRVAGVPLEIKVGDLTRIRLQPPNRQSWQSWLDKRRRVIDTGLGNLRKANTKYKL